MIGQCLSVFFMSMVPIVELRGAIPMGIAEGIAPPLVYLLAVVGNLIPAPLIILLINKLFELLRRIPRMEKIISWIEKRGHLQGRMVQRYGFLGLFIIVAVPLPGTGAWTGSLVAALLEIPMRKALPAIIAGVLVAGGIVLAISCGVATVVN